MSIAEKVANLQNREAAALEKLDRAAEQLQTLHPKWSRGTAMAEAIASNPTIYQTAIDAGEAWRRVARSH